MTYFIYCKRLCSMRLSLVLSPSTQSNMRPDVFVIDILANVKPDTDKSDVAVLNDDTLSCSLNTYSLLN